MDVGDITPVILTFDEEPNIGRVLDRLSWARTVVVVDSFSTDRTVAIAATYPNVRLLQRVFDDHRRQWTYAVDETGITTPWVLTLDADYIVSAAFVQELAALAIDDATNGYEARFRFCIHGRPLRRSLYPPRVVLFRRAKAAFYQDGHTQRLKVEGSIGNLSAPLDLDDRKPIGRWIVNQDKYVRLERDKLRTRRRGDLSLPDRLRAGGILAPILVLFYCLFVKRMILAGLPGWYYTYQRVGFEILLSLYLIEDRFAASGEPPQEPKAGGERR